MKGLYYRSFGVSGPALVVAHGLFGSSTNWRSIAASLGERYRVFVPDLRNHGRSPWSSTMDYATLADDLATFIRSLKLEPVTLLGHSLGGKAAMTLGLTEPTMVYRLIVVDIAPIRYDHSHLPLIDAMRKLDLSAVRSRKNADELLQPAIADPRLRSFLLQNLTQNNDGLRWRINLEALAANMPALLDFPNLLPRRFDGGALFIHGSQSDYLLPQHTPTIQSYFPNAAFAVIENAGHWLHAEQPRRFLQTVEQVMRR